MKGFVPLLMLALVWAICPASAKADDQGPLSRYVTKPDDSFRWSKRREGTRGDATWVELTMTSQTWQGITWKHQLYLIKPSKVRDPSRALLVIGGGAWKEEFEKSAAPDEPIPSQAGIMMDAAEQLGTPIAVVLQVPQQPLFGGMTEDRLISYTFEKYLRTGDETWPLLFPMTKSAVRAMDALAQYAHEHWSMDITTFTVTGASKRGWTTWLTAAVDPRVSALAPMVIDTLNMGPQMAHQVTTWGSFSEQIQAYTDRGLQALMVTPSGQKLTRMIDPYSYRDKLTQPKLILLGTNDRYWPLDALNIYWDGLSGPKYALYAPNQGHGLKDIPRMVGSIVALHRQAAGEIKLPEMQWKYTEADGKLRLTLTSDVKPASVALWSAEAATRDFREAHWESQPVEAEDGKYLLSIDTPTTGYRAMFGEVVFDGDAMPYYLSTNVRIVGSK